MIDFTIALFLQLGLLVLLGRALPGGKKSNLGSSWPTPLSCEPRWDAARRMIEREFGSYSRSGGYDEEEA
jgi:hypothetical protein